MSGKSWEQSADRRAERRRSLSLVAVFLVVTVASEQTALAKVSWSSVGLTISSRLFDSVIFPADCRALPGSVAIYGIVSIQTGGRRN